MPALARLIESFGDPDLLGDLVGSREADPVDVFRQHVRIAPNLLNRLIPIGLVDAYRPAGADAVAVEEQHDLADLLSLLPCLRDPLPALGADPIYRFQFGGAVFDHGENIGSKAPHQLLGENRADALDQAAAEVPLDPFGVVGGTVFRVVALNCSPCSLSLTHQPSALSHSPALTDGREPTTVTSSRCPRAFTRRTQKPLSSLWKVTRSINPEICSVAGRRSGGTAFMDGDSFSHVHGGCTAYKHSCG